MSIKCDRLLVFYMQTMAAINKLEGRLTDLNRFILVIIYGIVELKIFSLCSSILQVEQKSIQAIAFILSRGRM